MPERPRSDFAPDYYTGPIVMFSISNTIVFLFFCLILAHLLYPTVAPREKPWVPAWARGDACLTPLFFVLPAFFWPLIFPTMIICFIYFVLKSLMHGVWSLVGPATSCCGIRLPRHWLGNNIDGIASLAPDLEMGSFNACSEVSGGSGLGGGVNDVDPAGVRCAGSGESERPPSYTSLQPEKDDSREADGLLVKNAE